MRWRRLERTTLISTRHPGLSLEVYCARSFRHRLVGLLGTDHPPGANEALMLSPAGSIHTIGMRYPLTLVYLSADWRVLATHPATSPGRVVIAPRGACHCLEMNTAPAWCPSPGEQLHETGQNP